MIGTSTGGSRGRDLPTTPGAAVTGWLRRWAAVTAAGALAACAGADGGDDGPIELKFGHVGAPESLYDRVITEFAERVNTSLDGRVEVTVYGSSQLGSDETLLQKLKLGTVDIILPSTVMSGAVDQFALFEMPYLVRDREHMKELEETVIWPDLVPLAEAQGYRILALWENGFRHITNSRGPIETPADLSGLKLRTPRSPWRVRLFQALGANPTPMPFSEVFIALQTGVMDAQENPLAQIYSAKLHEVQTYLSLSGHVYTPAYLTVSSRRWDRLPPDVQDTIAHIAREMQPFVYENAARMDEEILAAMRAEGVAVNEVDRAAFVMASEPVYRQFAANVEGGEALLAKALAGR